MGWISIINYGNVREGQRERHRERERERERQRERGMIIHMYSDPHLWIVER